MAKKILSKFSLSAGRPVQGDIDKREMLMDAAKKCFTHYSYEKVTTRILAKEANVDAGLIRYYFLNKAGLYKAMFTEMMESIMTDVQTLVHKQQMDSFEPFFQKHAQILAKYPEFPILFQRELMGEGICQDYVIETFKHLTLPVLEAGIKQMQDKGKVRKEINPMFLRVTIMSLLIFPWLSKVAAEKIDGVSFTPEIFDELIKHSTDIIENGCFVKAS